ncbi:flagellar hook assembly protein FlgD [Gynuella sp.]|uniref:flagellar hook assembly protein FlgD n=1 Tax=Gynuella sp. TaxID=2969146 RepID=UPI003D0E2B99
MSNVNGVSGRNGVLDQYALDPSSSDSSSTELGKTEFLELMIAQLNNQNPLDPQDNAEFVAQLAQFSMVEGIENVNGSMADLASAYTSSQALQASSLVGSSVTLDGRDESQLVHGDIIYGITDIPESASNIVLTIKNEDRQIVEEIALSDLGDKLQFKWDGAYLEINGEILDLEDMNLEQDEEGNYIAHDEGNYTFTVSADIDDQYTILDTSMSTKVESVAIDSRGNVTLNLLGGDSVGLKDVVQINDLDG